MSNLSKITSPEVFTTLEYHNGFNESSCWEHEVAIGCDFEPKKVFSTSGVARHQCSWDKTGYYTEVDGRPLLITVEKSTNPPGCNNCSWTAQGVKTLWLEEAEVKVEVEDEDGDERRFSESDQFPGFYPGVGSAQPQRRRRRRRAEDL